MLVLDTSICCSRAHGALIGQMGHCRPSSCPISAGTIRAACAAPLCHAHLSIVWPAIWVGMTDVQRTRRPSLHHTGQLHLQLHLRHLQRQNPPREHVVRREHALSCSPHGLRAQSIHLRTYCAVPSRQARKSHRCAPRPDLHPRYEVVQGGRGGEFCVRLLKLQQRLKMLNPTTPCALAAAV